MVKRKRIPLWRHTAKCLVCRHQLRQEIEALFLDWKPLAELAREFRVSRQSLYRHFRAVGSFETRSENIRELFKALINKGMESPRIIVSPAIVLAAGVAISKLDAHNRTVEKVEANDFSFLSDARWTRGEMLKFAQTGELPSWYVQGSIDQ
jgi:AcrR family transcriptional regulator